MKGVVLAGGKGTRLGELTRVTNKHLLPVGDMPMIYYPIKKLIGCGITDIMLVTGTEHMGDFVGLLGSGHRMGCDLTYRVQDEAGGIAQALSLAKDFCKGHMKDSHRGSSCTVILGDNIFFDKLTLCEVSSASARLYLKEVPDPGRYGVAELDENDWITSIEEKPANPKSSWAVTGIYVFSPLVFDVISKLKPSKRGELEITDVNNAFLATHCLHYNTLPGYWTDAGTPESLQLANRLVVEQPPEF